jgi:hypothetical protein
MTLAMPDSIDVNALPSGYDAYLGYADGRWPTAKTLRARFPSAELVILTVTGRTVLGADGADVENGDLTPAEGAYWAMLKLAPPTMAGFRPVLYASVGAMGDVLEALHLAGIYRNQVRLLSAHYGAGAHICGPSSCGEISIEMDGTQWANQAIGLNGSVIDMSMLAENFFDQPTALTRTERIVQELPILRSGSTGMAVKRVQALLNLSGTPPLKVDGIFGPETEQAIRTDQTAAKITVDGIVGPATWSELLGVA